MGSQLEQFKMKVFVFVTIFIYAINVVRAQFDCNSDVIRGQCQRKCNNMPCDHSCNTTTVTSNTPRFCYFCRDVSTTCIETTTTELPATDDESPESNRALFDRIRKILQVFKFQIH